MGEIGFPPCSPSPGTTTRTRSAKPTSLGRSGGRRTDCYRGRRGGRPRRRTGRYAPAMSRPGYAYHLRELVGYEEGWELQRRAADSVASGALPDTVLLLEHALVITLGRRTEPGELHVPDGAEVEIVETDRGGKSTYHGPGQLVCYPIV